MPALASFPEVSAALDALTLRVATLEAQNVALAARNVALEKGLRRRKA